MDIRGPQRMIPGYFYDSMKFALDTYGPLEMNPIHSFVNLVTSSLVPSSMKQTIGAHLFSRGDDPFYFYDPVTVPL